MAEQYMIIQQIDTCRKTFQTGAPEASDLEPHWGAQQCTLFVPCKVSTDFFWARCGQVASLCDWFEAFSVKECDMPDDCNLSATHLYFAYLHKLIVAVKRYKDVPRSRQKGKGKGKR